MNQDESDKQTHFCSLLDFLFDIFQDRKGFLFCRLGHQCKCQTSYVLNSMQIHVDKSHCVSSFTLSLAHEQFDVELDLTGKYLQFPLFPFVHPPHHGQQNACLSLQSVQLKLD